MYIKIAGIKSEKLLGESPAQMQLDVSTKATHVAEGGPRALAQGVTAPAHNSEHDQNIAIKNQKKHTRQCKGG